MSVPKSDCVDSAMHDGPVHDGPMHDGPMHDGPMHDGPMHDGPMHDGPMHDGPVHDGPMHDGPMHDGPMHDGPMHDGPMRGRSLLDRDEERRWRVERRSREEQRRCEERRWLEKPMIVGLSATELRKAEWLEAMRWRRRVASVCAASQLTFLQWLLLHSARHLIAEANDAVIQAQIAARAELEPTTVSLLVRKLEERQLVDRSGDMTGKAWRVYLTTEAERLLGDLDDSIETVSANGL